MKLTYKFFWMAMVALTLSLTSCGDDDEEIIIPTPEEVITTLTYTLTPTAGGDAVTMNFQDLDGDGGNDPVITGGTLKSNTEYTGGMVLLNESESPAEDITVEIKEEDDEHQFFFAVSADLKITLAYTDQDANSRPVGLETTLNTGEASTGTMTVTLRHQPDKAAAGVADGDISNAGGETDIEVIFPVTIE